VFAGLGRLLGLLGSGVLAQQPEMPEMAMSGNFL